MIVFSYLLYYGLILPISILPFRVIYIISDFIYIFIYHFLGYRKKIVRINLRNSFPEKTDPELKNIERLFYHHFCDILLEAFKLFTISRTALLSRAVLKNPEILDPHAQQERSVMFGAGHYGNWEWVSAALGMQIKHETFALYAPLKDRFFNKKLKTARGRFGVKMISVKKAARHFVESKKKLTATSFGIDQSPLNSKNCHWMTFLHQDTGVMYGLEKSARSLDYPVLFIRIEKVRRGYYEIYLDPVTDDPQLEQPFHIIEKATRYLEAEIIKSPSNWLWTHRRWKRQRTASA
jgi:KDO2-lipid IV(A) lauroyltransferase